MRDGVRIQTRHCLWQGRPDDSESTRLCKIEENDDRWIADRGVVAGEVEAAGLGIHAEDGDVVVSLIATIEEPAGGVEVEAAGIVSPCPFFPDKCQDAV